MEKKKLTEKQKRFIQYYVELGNQTEAARKAGYKSPHVQGAQNLEKLRSYIDEMIAKKDSSRIASQDEVLQFFTSIMRGEKIKQTVVVENMTEDIEVVPSPKDRLEGAKSLAKRYGLDRAEESTQNDEPIRIILERPKKENP